MIIPGILSSSASGHINYPAGYIMGGYNGSSTNQISTILFSTDAVSNLSATLSAASYISAGLSNAGLAGYDAIGNNPAVSTINKLTFSTNAVSTLSATLPTAVDQAMAVSNSGTAGYLFGGSSNSGGNTFTVIQKLTFSGETTSTLSPTINPSRGNRTGAGFGNYGVAGYIAGGYDGLAYVASIFKWVFSTEAISTISPTLSSGQQSGVAAMSNSGTAGYISGGDNSGAAAAIQKLAYSNDTKSTLSATTFAALNNPVAVNNYAVGGYFVGGYNMNSSSYTGGISKLLFSNDTTSTLSGSLSTGRSSGAGVHNSI